MTVCLQMVYSFDLPVHCIQDVLEYNKQIQYDKWERRAVEYFCFNSLYGQKFVYTYLSGSNYFNTNLIMFLLVCFIVDMIATF